MSTYGYQAARNTYGLPGNTNTLVQQPVAPVKAPAVSTSTPYGGQVSKNTTTYPGAATPSVAAPAAPTKTVAPTPVAQPSTGPAAPVNPMFDYQTDPILQQVQAQAAQSNADAQAAALASQKQLAVQYGDVDLANQIGDSATAAAAGANPYSIYAQLAHQQPLDEQALDENLNKGNLYYSGARINQQSDLANQYGVTRANDATQEQSALAQIQQALLTAQLTSRQSVDQANSDAYNRFLQQLLTNPPAGTATTGATNGGSGGDQAVFTGQAPGANGYPILDMSNPVESPYNPVGPASFTGATTPTAPGYSAYPTLDLSPPKPAGKAKTTSSYGRQTAKNSY